MKHPAMRARDVRRAFKRHWANRIAEAPAYKDDLPAKRQAFDCFLDDLWVDGKITSNMLYSVTMEDPT